MKHKLESSMSHRSLKPTHRPFLRTTLLILPLMLTLTATFVHSDPTMLIGTETQPVLLPETTSPANQEETKKIDTQLQTLYSELQRYRKDEINTEMKAQPYMFDSWHEFVQEVKISENDQQHIKELKSQIKTLIERKQALQKQPSPH